MKTRAGLLMFVVTGLTMVSVGQSCAQLPLPVPSLSSPENMATAIKEQAKEKAIAEVERLLEAAKRQAREEAHKQLEAVLKQLDDEAKKKIAEIKKG